MAIDYRILHDGNHVQIVGTDDISPGEFIGLVKALTSDPCRQPESTALIDLRKATYAPVDNEKVIQIALVLEAYPALLRNRIAIVARKSTLFAAEVFSAHVRAVANVEIRVFVDFKAAEVFCLENMEQELAEAVG